MRGFLFLNYIRLCFFLTAILHSAIVSDYKSGGANGNGHPMMPVQVNYFITTRFRPTTFPSCVIWRR